MQLSLMKLELGCGFRPTRSYEHNDLHPFPHVEHVGEPWMLELPDNSLEEVLALAFIEHLTYEQTLDTFRNVRRMLKMDGLFLFDVPNYPVWAQYYLDSLSGKDTPVPLDHIRRTLFGWQRWLGDEHKYGWDEQHLVETLKMTGFQEYTLDVNPFIKRTFRQRFHKPWDAHLYVVAKK